MPKNGGNNNNNKKRKATDDVITSKRERKKIRVEESEEELSNHSESAELRKRVAELEEALKKKEEEVKTQQRPTKPASPPRRRSVCKIPLDLGAATAAAIELRSNKLVLALVLERFRNEPFAHTINLSMLAREIIEDDRLCTNPAYNHDLVVKFLSQEVRSTIHYLYLPKPQISVFLCNERTKVERNTETAIKKYKGWLAEKVDRNNIDPKHIFILTYLGYLAQMHVPSARMLEYITDILPKVLDRCGIAIDHDNDIDNNDNINYDD